MARDGKWIVWMGMWTSSAVLAPLGVFLTYKSNKDSVVLNADAYINWFKKIMGIRSVRHIFKKEVIIHDPDYPRLTGDLEQLTAECRAYAAKKRGSCRRTEDVAGLSGSWSGIVRSRAVPRGAAAGIPPQTVESLLVFHVKRLYAHACSPAGVRPMLRLPSALVRAYGAGSRWHSVWFAQSASSVSREMLVRVGRGRGNAVR